MQRLADLLDMGGSDKRGALRIALQALAETPSDEWAITTSRRLAGESGGWPELVEAYEAAVPRADRRRGRGRSRCCRRWRPRTRASWRIPSWRSRATRRSSRSRAKDPDAVAALERLYIATGRFADLLAVYDKKLSMAKSKAEELEIRFKLASLYEEEIKQPDKAIELYGAIVAQDPAQLPALSALDRLYQQLGRWKDLAETIAKEIDLSTDMAAVAELKFRRGAVLEQYLDDGAGAVASYREALEIDSSHVGARTALQAYLSNSDGELQRAAVKVLEPIYEANNDLARLVEVQRIKLGAREEDRQARRPAVADRQARRPAR